MDVLREMLKNLEQFERELLSPRLPPLCAGCGRAFLQGFIPRTKCKECAPEQYPK